MAGRPRQNRRLPHLLVVGFLYASVLSHLSLPEKIREGALKNGGSNTGNGALTDELSA